MSPLSKGYSLPAIGCGGGTPSWGTPDSFVGWLGHKDFLVAVLMPPYAAEQPRLLPPTLPSWSPSHGVIWLLTQDSPSPFLHPLTQGFPPRKPLPCSTLSVVCFSATLRTQGETLELCLQEQSRRGEDCPLEINEPPKTSWDRPKYGGQGTQ